MRVFPITASRYAAYLRAAWERWSPLGQPGRRRALVSRVGGLGAFSASRGRADSCVLGNGIPKSGTYLINRVVEFLGLWENLHVHVGERKWVQYEPEESGREPVTHPGLPPDMVQKLRNGQFVAAHLPHSPELERVIARTKPNRRIRHLLIYRDPRDIFVSYTRFATYMEAYAATPSSREHQRFLREELADDDERLSHIIEKQMRYPYEKFLPWLENPHCLALKFEQLYPEVLAAGQGRLGPVISGALTYLGVDPSGVDPQALFKFVAHRSKTASAETEKVRQFEKYFKPEHYRQIDRPEFRRLVEDLGYRW